MKIKKLRYNRRKVFIGLFLFLLLIGVTIGYALITTTLSINGTAIFNDARWDIHFDNYDLLTGSVGNIGDPTITDTSITYTAKLEQAGDFYGFSVDIENEGTINARISDISMTPDFSTIDYVDSSITYSNDSPVQVGDVIKGDTTKTIKVKLVYKDDLEEELYPTTDQEFTVTLRINYEQFSEPVYELPGDWVLPAGRRVTNLELGDEICISNQCFNFIEYKGNDIVLLAKNNLKVGKIYDDYDEIGEYIDSDDGYGLQADDVLGVCEGTGKGAESFSYTNYWSEASYDLYDADQYAGEPGDDDYSIAYYVEAYKDKLEDDYGVSIKSARLLTFEEVTDSLIGCDVSNSSCPTTGASAFITHTSFWLGTAIDDDYVYNIESSGYFGASYYGNIEVGVRPVIVITMTNS